MPIYAYRCGHCKKERDDIRTIAERHTGPKCDRCGREMKLQISATAGVVVNPAVPRSRK